MEQELVNAMKEYREFTIELISCLEREDYDSLEYFLNKRQQILDRLSNMDYNREELSKVSEELQLLDYHKKLSDLMLKKRDKVKQDINSLTQRKNANNMYNKRVYGANVFSKKI
ncbi:flagellar protein FliT [Clostridiaceae bacterium UIB06]|nr:flagellar protein FliT [Clostridiaceae bacterium UIB06]